MGNSVRCKHTHGYGKRWFQYVPFRGSSAPLPDPSGVLIYIPLERFPTGKMLIWFPVGGKFEASPTYSGHSIATPPPPPVVGRLLSWRENGPRNRKNIPEKSIDRCWPLIASLFDAFCRAARSAYGRLSVYHGALTLC